MKLLIVRIGAMGDVLHALPSLAALRAVHPYWQIDWVVDPRWSPLLVNAEGAGPVVHRVHLADTKLWSRAPFSLKTLLSVNALRNQLRPEDYDVAVDMQGTLRSAVVSRFCGAKVRGGYSDPREAQARWFYTHRYARIAPHVVDQGAELLGHALGLSLSPEPAPLPHEPWADAWAAGEAASGRLCLLAPGAGWAAKQWPLAKFAALARTLRGQGFDVVVNAPRQDNESALKLVAQSGGAARMLVCDVAGLLALLRRTSLLIGGDSGPTHLAAALGIPLVALFGPTDPARNAPWGPGPKHILRDATSVNSYKHVATEDPGLARIPVEQVFQAAVEVTTRSL